MELLNQLIYFYLFNLWIAFILWKCQIGILYLCTLGPYSVQQRSYVRGRACQGSFQVTTVSGPTNKEAGSTICKKKSKTKLREHFSAQKSASLRVETSSDRLSQKLVEGLRVSNRNLERGKVSRGATWARVPKRRHSASVRFGAVLCLRKLRLPVSPLCSLLLQASGSCQHRPAELHLSVSKKDASFRIVPFVSLSLTLSSSARP